MHELSVAEALIKQMEEILSKENAQKAISARLSVGALSGIEIDALEFALPIVAEGTKMDKCNFIMEKIPVTVECEDCSKKSEPELPMMECVHCGSININIIEGKDFTLTSMEVK
jgi:hydrogenase nickel incorporation protein HypA/HybF